MENQISRIGFHNNYFVLHPTETIIKVKAHLLLNKSKAKNY